MNTETQISFPVNPSHPPAIDQLAAALAQFNLAVPAIAKNKVNPHFRNSYADLTGIMDTVRLPLAKAGLSIVQLLNGDTITTMLVHASGQSIASHTPIMATKSDAQGYGSGVTYSRRYALCAILSVAADDDDDGNSAAAKPPRAAEKKVPAAAPLKEKAPKASSTDFLASVVSLQKSDKVTDKDIFAFLASKGAVTPESGYLPDLPAGVLKRITEVWPDVVAHAFASVAPQKEAA